MDINTIRKQYSRLTDDKLKSIAKNSILDLTLEGLTAMKEEVAKRRMPLLPYINKVLQNHAELQILISQRCEELRLQSCPTCGSNEYKLNAVWLHTITSGFSTNQQLHFGCFNCLKAEKLKAERNASIWAWLNLWQLPFNLRVISRNDRSITDLHKEEVTDSLRDFASMQLRAERSEQRRKQTTIEVTITKSQELQ
jgi:hypothetical protein